MWLVVPPAVGVPVFLGAVAIGSFAVHMAVLSKTTWYSDYLVGNLGETMEQASATILDEGDTKNAAYAVPMTDGTQQVLVILPDGTTATAIMQLPEVIKTGMAATPLVIEN
jgi:light-harvesting protein B-800-850 alpha chain